MPIFDNTENYDRGWLIGNFNPSLSRQVNFEICIANHSKDSKSQPHYHTRSTEYNIVLTGKVIVNDTECLKNDIFIYEMYEVSNVKFIEDTTLLIIRIPSAPDDKVII
jgi:hypothetical protein